MLTRNAGVTPLSHLLRLPLLARRIAPVALGLALGRLGRVADHLLDRLAPLAGLALDLLDGLPRSPLLGFLGLLGLALRLARLASRGDRHALLLALEHGRVVRAGPRL